jgi:DNA-binding MarR family transcriptional regulator
MLSSHMHRLFREYPKIYLACHRQHVRGDEDGRGLSERMAGILDHLHLQHPRTVSELARHLSVTESTMSIQISKLERFGYVRRVRDESDRRRVGVRLTSSGARLREQNSVLDPDLAQKMLSLLSVSNRELALHGLELLGNAAERLMERQQLRRRRTAK